MPLRTANEAKSFVNWYKATAPCTDCGGFFAAVCMDFDHIPERGEKSGNMSAIVAKGDRKQLWNEIAKCDVVCSNCHRLRTQRRGPSQFARDNMSKAHKGRLNSPETRAKLSATNKGMKRSEEARARMREAQGDPAQRERLSLALKASWAKRKARAC